MSGLKAPYIDGAASLVKRRTDPRRVVMESALEAESKKKPKEAAPNANLVKENVPSLTVGSSSTNCGDIGILDIEDNEE